MPSPERVNTEINMSRVSKEDCHFQSGGAVVTTIEPEQSGEPFGSMSVATFCRRYNIGRTTVFALISNGELEARKCGSRTLISRAAGEKWFAALPPRKKADSGDQSDVRSNRQNFPSPVPLSQSHT